MSDLFENPMGLCGFDFVEFTAPNEGVLEPVLASMGFTRDTTRHSTLLKQDYCRIFAHQFNLQLYLYCRNNQLFQPLKY